MGELFNRRAVLQMGTLRVEGLRIAFKIEKDDEPEPNAGEISVWNLSRHTRARLAEQTLPVILEAGLGEDIAQVFSGDIRPRGISSGRDGPDWVTTLRAGDGTEAFRKARIQKSLKKGAKLKDGLVVLLKSFGDGAKAAIKKAVAGDFDGALEEFVDGAVFSGASGKELERLLAANGYTYSIQDGQVQVVEKDGVTPEQAILLTPDTGLVGSPEPGKEGVDLVLSS